MKGKYSNRHIFTIILSLLIIMPAFLNSCRNEDIVDNEDKFAAVYVDLLIVNEKYHGSTELINSKTDSVYKSHGVTEEQYKSTIQYYQENPERWKQFFTKAESYLRLKRRNNQL